MITTPELEDMMVLILAYATNALLGLILFKIFHVLLSPVWRTPLPPVMQKVQQKDGTVDPPWKQYAQASYVQGPLITLSSVGAPVIVLNTLKPTIDLMQNRPSFNDKPRWPMAELLGRQENVGFSYHGERHRKARKVLTASLNPNSVSERWANLLDEQSRRLLRVFADFQAPMFFYEAVQSNAQQLIVRLAYGRDPDTAYLNLARKVKTETSVALQPGRWYVNQFPILMWVPAWFPGAGFRRWANEAKASFLQMTREPFEKVEETMKSGHAEPSFVRDALASLPPNSKNRAYDRGVIMSCGNSLFAAGSETIDGTLLTFLALIIRHPEVQWKAYREILSVVGIARLPESSDAPFLPYVDALIQEVHRFNPAIPFVSHSNIVEEKYEGFRIPKKAWVMANIWAILHDGGLYAEPGLFSPERFIASKTREAERDPRTLVYGFGGRICPGRHLANAYIFLVVSRAIFLFDIQPDRSIPRRSLGEPDFLVALVPAPRPFNCAFEPREHAANFLELE